LIRSKLATTDIVPKLELLASTDAETLRELTRVVVSALDQTLVEASSDTNVKAKMQKNWRRPATIVLQDPQTGQAAEYTIPSLADLGDDPN
jgi:hypothetical protein